MKRRKAACGDEFFSLPLFPQTASCISSDVETTSVCAGTATAGATTNANCCKRPCSACSNCGTTCGTCANSCPRCGCAMTAST